MIAGTNWYEQGGNGHGGANGLRQAAIAEDNFMATDEIGGDAAIGNRQIVERFQVRVRKSFPIDEQIDLMTGIEAGGEGDSFLESEMDEGWIGGSVFPGAIRKIFCWHLSAHDLNPVL